LKLDARHKLYGHTIAEHIRAVPDELPFDAVGLGKSSQRDVMDLT
jgi:hypothetical protein